MVRSARPTLLQLGVSSPGGQLPPVWPYGGCYLKGSRFCGARPLTAAPAHRAFMGIRGPANCTQENSCTIFRVILACYNGNGEAKRFDEMPATVNNA